MVRKKKVRMPSLEGKGQLRKEWPLKLLIRIFVMLMAVKKEIHALDLT